MVQNLYRNWLLVSKITWEIWTTSNKQWKVQKVEICWATFVQKLNSFSWNITENLSNMTFINLPENYLYHFWNYNLFFTTQFHCIFLFQTLNTLDKKSLKMNILRFLSAPLKFTKFVMCFMKQQIIFPSRFASIFSIMTHTFSIHFYLKHYILWSKGAH